MDSQSAADVHGVPETPSMIAQRSDTSDMRTPRSNLGYGEGDQVWTPSETYGYRRCTIVSMNGSDSFLVECRDDENPAQGGQYSVRPAEVKPYYDYGPEKTWADNTEMVHLDDANILHNIRKRYYRDEIYTYTANVLLAINPYKSIPGLYTPEKIAEYRGRSPGMLPPHPYAIADTAYRQQLREKDKKNQALVISGESGAGKTETAKHTMQYLTQVSRTDAAHGGRIQERIINSNPILESFGNASTVRNSNSSRFGKYNEMYFDAVGSLMCAGIKTYLLESSRVVHQQPGERNFHVFYEMLAGLDPDDLDQLQLENCHPYKLLYADGSQPLEQDSPQMMREREKFSELRRAMATFVSQEEQMEFWEVIAALIHLGEVEFVDLTGGQGEQPLGSPTPRTPCASPGPGGSPTDAPDTDVQPKVEVHEDSQDALDQAAELLDISRLSLEQALKFKEMRIPGRPVILSPRSQAQAMQTLQSIIKILYKRLFDEIVRKINESSAGRSDTAPSERFNSIGTLDIYGFERLQTNSFEQLCINLANERLQQFFIEEVLEAEQRVYAEEGLDIPRVKLPDNRPVVNSIESITVILDEHSLRARKGLVRENDADNKFCEHVHRDHIKDPRHNSGPVLPLKMSSSAARAGNAMRLHDGFQIRHYAGDVSYTTKGWIEKNSDALVPEVEGLLCDTKKNLTSRLSEPNNVNAASTNNSVSQKYLGNLNDLLATLQRCHVHYIRCFNPNDKREPGHFIQKYVLEQVKNCGTEELVKIMHYGYPNRCMLGELRQRFTEMLPPDFARYRDREFMLGLMLAFEIDESQWTIGTRRLFLKAGQLRVLENMRDVGSMASKEIIKKIRMQFARRKVRSVVKMIAIATWWPKYIRKQRRSNFLRRLRQSLFVFVRLHRWLRKARTSLYGKQPTPPHLKKDFKASAHMGHGCRQQGNGRLICRGFPKAFVALNLYEEPEYPSFLKRDINMRSPIEDNVLKIWQHDTTENVLLHNGSEVLVARFSPKVLCQARAPLGLDDVRRLDVAESSQALPLDDVPHVDWHIPVVTIMCQHRMDKQMFASCDENNDITVWRWHGTDASDPSKIAFRMIGAYVGLGPEEQVLGMCFLSQNVVPRRITDQQGTVLVILRTNPNNKNWLFMQVISIYQGSHYTELIKTVPIHTAQIAAAAADEDLEIHFFEASHTERVLMIGGRHILKFYTVDTRQEGDKSIISLEPVLDVVQEFAEVRDASFTTCLSLPPPTPSIGMLDWVVIGDDAGRLLGWKFNSDDHGNITLDESMSGKFRSNLHTPGVRIRSLIGIYGSSADSHYRHVQNSGLSYSLFLNKVAMEDRCFYSLAEDGKLLVWRMRKEGWKSSPESQLPTMESAQVARADEASMPQAALSGQNVACHASRLLPNILLWYDQRTESFRFCDRRLESKECRAGGA
mmetsp:Transcript_58779/g.148913  ORF Transcript_58779/g.148913 Transcript_58779/m.148913 type:complete len:1423 (+) Transcript_58779:92-4360(+)